jgi:predicted nuclease with TOPRIM domain
MKNVYAQEEKMILANQSIKGDATLKAAELKEAADFQRQRLTELYQKLQDNDRNLKKMEIELQKINKQLTELNQKKDLATSEVIVALDVKEAMNADFRLSYLVQQSSWYPAYLPSTKTFTGECQIALCGWAVALDNMML